MGLYVWAAAADAAVEGGGYVSIWKTIPPLLLLMLWGRLMTWVDKDAPAAHLPRIGLNIGFLCGLVGAYFLFFALPNFWIALLALVLVMGAEAATYLVMRKQRVGLGDLRKQFDAWIKSFGK